MGRAAAKLLATYDDLLALPPGVTGELVGGALYTQPRPAGPHATATSGLGMDLGNPFQRGRGGPGGWLIYDEPELHLGDSVLVPDLAGWRVERLPIELRRKPWFEVAPDWVCEALSPSTARVDREVKAPVYAQHGVERLWLLDPVAGSLDAYRRQERHWLWLGAWSDHAEARIPPFDAVPLDLVTLFREAGVERE